MIQLLFHEVRVTSVADSPVLVLREAEGTRQLPIWISAAAGAAILSALDAEDAEHPPIHDLVLEIMATQSTVLESLRILSCADGVYHAELDVNGSAVTCRVSDGVALALRSGAPMYAAAELLADMGLSAEPDPNAPAADAEVEQFREFLANVKADDFDSPGDVPPTAV